MFSPYATDRFVNVAQPEPIGISGPHQTAGKKLADAADAAFEWHASHQRADAPPSYPIRGFGDRGIITLWLPNAEVSQSMEIIDGEPHMVVVPSAMTTPDMSALRHQTLLKLRDPEGRLRFDISLVRYAIALIRLCYEVTDADLKMLLAGNHWHQEIVRHLIGGDQQVDRLLRGEVSAVIVPPPKVVVVPTASKPRWWWRFGKR